MACCIFTAYFMSKVIKACELFDIRLLQIKYNDFDPDSDFGNSYAAPSGYSSKNDGWSGGGLRQTRKGVTASDGIEPLKTTRLTITGMTCSACVLTLTQALKSHPHVLRTNISLPLSRATIIYDSTATTVEDLVNVVEDVGYGAEVLGQGEGGSAVQNLRLLRREKELKELKIAFNGAASWASIIVGVDYLRGWARGSKYGNIVEGGLLLVCMAIALWIQFQYGRWIHQNAWSKCVSKKRLQLPTLSMDTMLSLSLLLGMMLSCFNIWLHGLGSSATKSYFTTTSFLTVVISGGRFLDVTLKRQGTAGVATLYGMQRDMELGYVLVEGDLDENAETEDCANETSILTPVPTTLLVPLDTFHLSPYSIIPCDCYVVRGNGLVDESSMTGESIPIRKTVGDFLVSGTRNLSRELVAVVLKPQEESSLAKLVESIAQATETKYSSDNDASTSNGTMVADSITKHFVSIVLVLACLGFILAFRCSPSTLPFFDRIGMACERSMAILAAACPCALGLANPSAVMAGVDALYAHGVLLPGGNLALERLTKLTHMVLDKTGTLTEGRLEVSEAHFEDLFRQDSRKMELVYCLLCAAEREEAQSHPVARAVFQWGLRQMQAQGTGGNFQSSGSNYAGTALTRNISSALGKGLSAEAQGPNKIWYKVHVGSARFLTEQNIAIRPQCQQQLSDKAETTTVHIAIDSRFVGTLHLRDTVRKSAPGVIKQLESLGLSLTMLTGDAEAEAQRVSKILSIPVLASKSLPHEKKELVEHLQAQGQSQPRSRRHVVAMVGDGLNDTPAQSAADVGIHLSLSLSLSRATALSTDAADVIVLSPNLAALPALITIARKTVAQARFNRAWAAVYNCVAIAIAMGLGERWGIIVDASTAGIMMAGSSVTVLAMSLVLRKRLNG